MDIKEKRLKVGELVKWRGDNSGRIDEITKIVKAPFGGVEYLTKETNPKIGEKPKIGKQFWDRFSEHKDVGLEKLGDKEELLEKTVGEAISDLTQSYNDELQTMSDDILISTYEHRLGEKIKLVE